MDFYINDFHFPTKITNAIILHQSTLSICQIKNLGVKKWMNQQSILLSTKINISVHKHMFQTSSTITSYWSTVAVSSLGILTQYGISICKSFKVQFCNTFPSKNIQHINNSFKSSWDEDVKWQTIAHEYFTAVLLLK